MGSLERRGAARSYFIPLAGEAARRDLFDGIETTWGRLPGGGGVAEVLSETVRLFEPAHPEKVVPLLVKARTLVQPMRDPVAQEKLAEIDEAIALCMGLWIDAQAERSQATPGSNLAVAVTLINRSPLEIAFDHGVVEGMWSEPLPSKPAALRYNQPLRINYRGQVPPSQPYSQPYWLAEPRQGSAYTVREQRLIGLPENPPVAQVRIRLRVLGAEIELVRPVLNRYVDRAEGERTRPLVIVPPVAVELPQDVFLFAAARMRRIPASLRANAANVSGEFRQEPAAGWKVAPGTRPFRISSAGEEREITFEVTPPAAASTGRLQAVASVDGREIASGVRVLRYPHFPEQTWFPPSQSKLVRTDVRLTARHVGYIMGAGDEVPGALRELGCEVTMLGPSELAHGNLSAFDAIVAGVRSYNVRSDLRAHHSRLMEYVQTGGTYIVQYNTPDPVLPSSLGPYPFALNGNSFAARVSVEDAPVSFSNPAHPLLKGPNPITKEDFKGWVQERGLYFAAKWDPKYQTIFESHDPGQQPMPGGTLYTRYGKGVYIFTAYAWFRQLPAGVPGAYRVFANMLSAK
jgi:hypothetical protein